MAARRIDGKWYADFRFQDADGTVERVRKRSPVQSKAGADEFEHRLRTELLTPVRTTAKEVPKFSAYATEFMARSSKIAWSRRPVTDERSQASRSRSTSSGGK